MVHREGPLHTPARWRDQSLAPTTWFRKAYSSGGGVERLNWPNWPNLKS